LPAAVDFSRSVTEAVPGEDGGGVVVGGAGEPVGDVEEVPPPRAAANMARATSSTPVGVKNASAEALGSM